MAIMKNYLLGSRYSKRWSLYTYHIGDYMKRWCFKTPYGSIRLHHILRSDDDRALHDHPMGFWTFLLTGGYTEILPLYDMSNEFYEGSTQIKEVRRRWLNFRWVGAEQPHRLILDKPVWTLVFAKPTIRTWGFYVGGFGKKFWVSEYNYFGSGNK